MHSETADKLSQYPITFIIKVNLRKDLSIKLSFTYNIIRTMINHIIPCPQFNICLPDRVCIDIFPKCMRQYF